MCKTYYVATVQDRIHFFFQLCLFFMSMGGWVFSKCLWVKNQQNLAYVVYGWPLSTLFFEKKNFRNQYVSVMQYKYCRQQKISQDKS